MVMDTPERDPELCLGGIEESYPPQCGGIPMSGWDWELVEGEESAGKTTWGTFHVVGRYDGDIFTVREASSPKPFEPEEADPVDTPCSEPDGGWVAPDPTRASHEHVVAAQRVVEGEPDFAGLWIDYYNEPAGGPTEEDPGDIILNVAFTGDLEAHEQELRELWGGPLCVTQEDHTLKELEQIQREFPADDFDLETTWSNLDVVEGVVEIGVIVVDEETLQRIEDRYGPGTVKVVPALIPVR